MRIFHGSKGLGQMLENAEKCWKMLEHVTFMDLITNIYGSGDIMGYNCRCPKSLGDIRPKFHSTMTTRIETTTATTGDPS